MVHADGAGSWDNWHERFEVKRINPQEAYSTDGACTNRAEEYFSRLRRAEVGIHHRVAGAYLRYAQGPGQQEWPVLNLRAAKETAPARGRAEAVGDVSKWGDRDTLDNPPV